MSEFDAIADDLHAQGWSLRMNFLTAAQVDALQGAVPAGEGLAPAGVGRGSALQRDDSIRGDSIRWLDVEHVAEREYLALMDRLRLSLNQRLLLGLFDYEAHFARYAAGDFYQRHVDAFRQTGLDNKPRRVLTSVVYLNAQWTSADGGELVVWDHAGNQVLRVEPRAGAAIF